MKRKRIALTLPMGPDINDTITLVKWAEEHGLDDMWFSDAMAPDSLTMVAAVAPYTRRMRVGVAVTPVYTRTPAVLAATESWLALATALIAFLTLAGTWAIRPRRAAAA